MENSVDPGVYPSLGRLQKAFKLHSAVQRGEAGDELRDSLNTM